VTVTLDLSHLIALGGLIFTIVTTAIGLAIRNQQRLGHIEERVNTLETRMALLWRPIEERVAQMFKAPSHRRLDDLLDKFSAHTLSYEESWELVDLFERRLQEPDIPRNLLPWGILVLQAIRSLQLEYERDWGRDPWFRRFRQWLTARLCRRHSSAESSEEG
jgi:hypothetical protein